jgi:diguanylate cyclase (GGDEF)-like protein
VHGSEAFFRLIDRPMPPVSARIQAQVLLAGLALRDRQRITARLQRLLAGGPLRRLEINHWVASVGRRRLRVEIQQVHQEAAHGQVLTGHLVDVTPQAETAARLHRLTRYDSLTGLPNRQWLLEVLRDRLRSERAGMAVALLTIDRFHEVRQAYGHQTAEQVLLDLARRLQALTLARDAEIPALAASAFARGRIASAVHLGRDEFAMVLEDLPLNDAGREHCRPIMNAFSEPFRVAGRELFLRCSVGLDAVPLNGTADLEEASAWLERAESARRSAARAGGNRVRVFERRPSEDWAERLRIERDLQHAIDRGELALHLQPKVDARHGRILGFEGLMRWSRGGVLQAPSRFIPLAEEMGLIIPLGEWAIEQACEVLARLDAIGQPDCTLAVNLSARQLTGTRLSSVVAQALRRFAVHPARLELELTESALMHDAERAIHDLKAIRDLGVGLALDDFGTGYSSLAYLTRLPLSSLKIDRSFVQGLDASEPSRAVAAAVMTLGERLGLQVVAEGVERPTQRQALLQLGCTYQQGFLYGPARPIDEALHLLQNESPMGSTASSFSNQVDGLRRRGHRPAIRTSTATMANPLESGL